MKNVLWLVIIAAVTAVLALVWRVLPCRNSSCSGPMNECRYDLNALKKTDTNLLIKAGVHFVKPVVSNITALAVDRSDNIYVGSKSAIEVLDKNGVRIAGFPVNETVYCLAVDGNGDIFAGMKNHVEVLGRDGAKKAEWKRPDAKAEFTSIAVSSNFVFVADYVNRIVWRFSLSGELLGRIGGKDSDQRKEGFVVPSAFFDVAAAADGSVWIVSPGAHRVEHFTADGRFLSCWGMAGIDAEGFCGCCNPSNIAIMPDDSFVTSEKHIVRVKVYGPDGKFRGVVSGQEDWQKEAVGLDLAVDSAGRILVLDPQAGVVRVYCL